MNSREVLLDGKKFQGVEIPLPGAPLVVVYGQQGFVMCGYLNIEAANKLGVAAAVVRGVNTIDDVLKANIQMVSEAAQKKGVKVGDSAEKALVQLS